MSTGQNGRIPPVNPGPRSQACWDSRCARQAAGSSSRTRLAGQLFSRGRTSLRYSQASTALTMQLPINENQVAPVCAPPSEPANIQFLRPTTVPRSFCPCGRPGRGVLLLESVLWPPPRGGGRRQHAGRHHASRSRWRCIPAAPRVDVRPGHLFKHAARGSARQCPSVEPTSTPPGRAH
jgi:hypothetical protein